MTLAALAFAALGLPDGLLGVAWPSLRATFRLPLDALGPLLACYTGGYVASSFGSGRLMARLGLGRLLVASCAATGLCLWGYAWSGYWAIVLVLTAVAGIGAGGIDAGINTWAAMHHGPRLLSGLHACYGIGAAGGPMLLTAALAAGHPWQLGYVVVGSVQLGLASLFWTSRGGWSTRSGPCGHVGHAAVASLSATLRLATARWGGLLFVVYTGLELAIGAWSYTILTEGRGLPMAPAGIAASLYWVGLTTGRVLGAVFGDRCSPRALVRISLLIHALGLGMFAAGRDPVLDRIGLAVAGLGAGPVFPTLIASTPARVGAAHAGNAVGLQVAAAAVGQALVPSLLGVAGGHLGLDALATGLPAMALLAVVLHTISERTARAAASNLDAVGANTAVEVDR